MVTAYPPHTSQTPLHFLTISPVPATGHSHGVSALYLYTSVNLTMLTTLENWGIPVSFDSVDLRRNITDDHARND